MDPALREATLAAHNIQAPPSNLGASNAAELANLYKVGFQLPQATIASQAQGNNAEESVKQAEYAAKIAAQKEQDKKDIKAYKIVKKADGGYDFFDPTGEQVDIATLSERTGTNPIDLLKDSENPMDIQYVEDYTNLQDFIRAVVSGDKKKKDAYVKSRPELKEFNDKDGINRLIQQFRQSYQRYYTPRRQDPKAWGYGVPGNPLVPRSSGSEDDNTPTI